MDRMVMTDSNAEVKIERLTEVNEEAFQILNEYYEAVHVVQRDTPAGVGALVKEAGSGIWLARLGETVVGCAVLRRLSAIPLATECKRLYVRPDARGKGIAHRLLDAQESYAAKQGFRWIYLDSYDDLRSAISVYEKRGYVRCERYNDNPQATVFMRKWIGQLNG
jgi:GNAT superfamily N-acetyltransferase